MKVELWKRAAQAAIFSCLVLAAPVTAQSQNVSGTGAKAELHRAWDAFQSDLNGARQALDDPKFLPPPSTDRNLAEGYRYLLGHLARSIEWETQQNPDFPYFQRAVDLLSKWTIDNPDTMYLFTKIDGEKYYRLTGRPQAGSRWQDESVSSQGLKTPRSIVFQTSTSQVGDTGSMAELAACRNVSLSFVNQFKLDRNPDGSFEIMAGPERPKGYSGNFLLTKAALPCAGPDGKVAQLDHIATEIDVREVFYDWDNEVPLELDIAPVGEDGRHRPVRTPQEMAADLTVIAEKVRNQIRFWSALQHDNLGIYGDRAGKPYLPLNSVNQPDLPPASSAGGTAGAGQIYASGVFDLKPDEALVVKVQLPVEPYYMGLQLSNLWGELLDQATYASSRDLFQSARSRDGAVYYVIAHRDPGIQNWLDTTGLPRGGLGFRFVFDRTPDAAHMPHLEAQKVSFDSIAAHLPKDSTRISDEQRKEEIAHRSADIRCRWRQY